MPRLYTSFEYVMTKDMLWIKKFMHFFTGILTLPSFLTSSDALYVHLRQMALNFTWARLPLEDYEEFWHGYFIAEEPVVVKTIYHHVLFWTVTILTAVLLMRTMLGCKFWHMY